MKKIGLGILFIVVLGLVGGCVKQHRVVIFDKKEYKSCVLSCKQRFKTCKKSCTHSCQRCQAHRCMTSKAAYCRYVREEVVKGGYLVRQPNSYKDPLECRKTTCNCCADLNVCLQGCSGTIVKYLKPASACC